MFALGSNKLNLLGGVLIVIVVAVLLINYRIKNVIHDELYKIEKKKSKRIHKQKTKKQSINSNNSSNHPNRQSVHDGGQQENDSYDDPADNDNEENGSPYKGDVTRLSQNDINQRDLIDMYPR